MSTRGGGGRGSGPPSSSRGRGGGGRGGGRGRGGGGGRGGSSKGGHSADHPQDRRGPDESSDPHHNQQYNENRRQSQGRGGRGGYSDRGSSRGGNDGSRRGGGSARGGHSGLVNQPPPNYHDPNEYHGTSYNHGQAGAMHSQGSMRDGGRGGHMDRGPPRGGYTDPQRGGHQPQNYQGNPGYNNLNYSSGTAGYMPQQGAHGPSPNQMPGVMGAYPGSLPTGQAIFVSVMPAPPPPPPPLLPTPPPMYGSNQYRPQQAPMTSHPPYGGTTVNTPGMGRCPNPDGYDPPSLSRSSSMQSLPRNDRGGRRRNPSRGQDNQEIYSSNIGLSDSGGQRDNCRSKRPNQPGQDRHGSDKRGREPVGNRSDRNATAREKVKASKHANENQEEKGAIGGATGVNDNNRNAASRGRNTNRGRKRNRGGRNNKSHDQRSQQTESAEKSDDSVEEISDDASITTEQSDDDPNPIFSRFFGRGKFSRGRGGRFRGPKHYGRGRNYGTSSSNNSPRPVISEGSNTQQPYPRANMKGRSRRGRGRSGYPVFSHKAHTAGELISGNDNEVGQADEGDRRSCLSRSSSWDSIVSGVSSVASKPPEEISIDDIETLSIKTLQNRVHRYKMKLGKLRKCPDRDNESIKKLENAIYEINKVVKKRTEEERQQKLKQTENQDKQGSSESTDVQVENEFSDSSECSEEIVAAPKIRKTKVVLSKIGSISFHPKGNAKAKVPAPSKNKEKFKHKLAEPPKAGKSGTIDDSKTPKNVGNAKPPNTRLATDESNIKDLLKELDNVSNLDREVDMKKPVKEKLRKNKAVLDRKSAEKENSASTQTKASTQGLEPNAGEIFKFIVKQMHGKGLLNEIVQKSGLFHESFDAASWFRKHHRRFSYLEQNGITYIMVYDRDCTYCLDYITRRSCSSANCNRYHVCKDFLAGYCKFDEKCKYSHDFFSEKNIALTKKWGYNVFNNEEICFILQVQYPHICIAWNEDGKCDEKDCMKLHLCQRYLFGKCLEEQDCPLVHDRYSAHNKPIIDALKMSHLKEGIFRKMVYCVRTAAVPAPEVEQPREVPMEVDGASRKDSETEYANASDEVSEEGAVGGSRGAVGSSKEGGNESSGGVAVGGRNRNKKNRAKEEVTVDKKKPNMLTTDAGGDLAICETDVIGQCHTKTCRYHHGLKLPYLWQVKMYGSWVTLDLQEPVEQQYCNKLDKSDRIQIGEVFVVIIFEVDLRAYTDSYEELKVRRLSTRSYVEGKPGTPCSKTQWRWYWQNDASVWQLFETDALQYTLEKKFLARQTEYCYFRENYKHRYQLDFGNMEQCNLNTRKTRRIKRRPVFVSKEVIYSHQNPDPPSLKVPVPAGWMPWDLSSSFELVLMSEDSQEYREVKTNFYRTMDRHDCAISSVSRVQNPALWEKFCLQERNMIAASERNNRGSNVDKRHLYHGTSSLETVLGICVNTFDYRLAGKNGTVYGEGSYFARDAKYSDSYTDGYERYMFQASVLVGEHTKGERSYKRPPPKPDNRHELYDSCVNNMMDPTIFVVFDINQYYPEFLIKYTKRSAYAMRPSHTGLSPPSSLSGSGPTAGTGSSRASSSLTSPAGASSYSSFTGTAVASQSPSTSGSYSPPSSLYASERATPQATSIPDIFDPPRRVQEPPRPSPKKEDKGCCIQ